MRMVVGIYLTLPGNPKWKFQLTTMSRTIALWGSRSSATSDGPTNPAASVPTGSKRHPSDESNVRVLEHSRKEILDDITGTTGT